MTAWYRKRRFDLGLRAGGATLVALALAASTWLHRLVAADRTDDPSFRLFLLAALIFAAIAFGLALIVMGGRLWEPARISDRWALHPVPVARDMEPVLFAMDKAQSRTGEGPSTSYENTM